jgi:hypothetical protein
MTCAPDGAADFRVERRGVLIVAEHSVLACCQMLAGRVRVRVGSSPTPRRCPGMTGVF